MDSIPTQCQQDMLSKSFHNQLRPPRKLPTDHHDHDSPKKQCLRRSSKLDNTKPWIYAHQIGNRIPYRLNKNGDKNISKIKTDDGKGLGSRGGTEFRGTGPTKIGPPSAPILPHQAHTNPHETRSLTTITTTVTPLPLFINL